MNNSDRNFSFSSLLNDGRSSAPLHNPTVTYPASDINSSNANNDSHRFSTVSQFSERSSSLLSSCSAESCKWRAINNVLRITLRGTQRIQELWKDLINRLYDEVIDSERERRDEFRHSFWDFCVIHAQDSIDLDIVKEFIAVLTREGLSGVSAMKKVPGENQLDMAEVILNGSTKVFVLLSPTLNIPGLHKTFYQDILLRMFKEARWNRRLIPLQPSFSRLLEYKQKFPLCNPLKLPLGLNVFSEIAFNDVSTTIEEVREIKGLSLERQICVMERRREELCRFEKDLKQKQQSQLSQLKKGIEKLQHQLGDDRDPSDHLQLMLEQLNQNLEPSAEASSYETLVKMKECNQVQIGTSINFNFGQNNNQWE